MICGIIRFEAQYEYHVKIAHVSISYAEHCVAAGYNLLDIVCLTTGCACDISCLYALFFTL